MEHLHASQRLQVTTQCTADFGQVPTRICANPVCRCRRQPCICIWQRRSAPLHAASMRKPYKL
jgi:hypothetical protein